MKKETKTGVQTYLIDKGIYYVGRLVNYVTPENRVRLCKIVNNDNTLLELVDIHTGEQYKVTNIFNVHYLNEKNL